MRLEKLIIRRFRNLENLEIKVERNSRIICLVGENGAGKSNVLELIGAAASRLGIMTALDSPRGNALVEPHDFSATFYIDPEVHTGMGAEELASEPYRLWDGTLTVDSTQTALEIRAGGNFESIAPVHYGQRIVTWLQNNYATFVLWMDADRSFSAPPINDMPLGAVLGSSGENPQQLKASAVQRSASKYDGWVRSLLTSYVSAAMSQFNGALKSADKTLTAVDPFDQYSLALGKVLPHLSFAEVDPAARALKFSNGQTSLRFDQLSGGEREIAFIIGQLYRHNLQRGLILIDEPELHLNPELVRRWVTFLRGFSSTGQTWLATHSLEAIESAGFENTLLLRKSEGSSQTTSVERLSDQPVQRVLTGALGHPAFSLSRQIFVLIEGDRTGEERERFLSLVDDGEFVFVESGGCAEVKRLTQSLSDLAADLSHDLRVHGIVDSDERPDSELAKFRSDDLFSVLSCFEIENVYLFPSAVQAVIHDFGKTLDAENLIREASDKLAGRWILERAFLHVRKRPDELSAVRALLMPLSWPEVELKESGFATELESAVSDMDVRADLLDKILDSVREYRALRGSADLWRRCFGKEVSKATAKRVGLSDPKDFEFRSRASWSDGRSPVPPVLEELRTELAKLKR